MASAVIAVKLKCGRTLASMSETSLLRLPARISLSLAIRSTTSRVTFFTSTSGGSWASAGPASRKKRAVLISFFASVILQLLLPGRPPIVDQAAPPLQIGVALESVLVERRLLENAARIEKIGARLREPQPDQRIFQVIGPHFGEGVGVEIDARADAIAQRARAQNRQHEIGPRPDAPAAEGLAEVLVVLLVAHVARHIVDAEEADGAIKRKARPVADTVLKFSLQEIVQADERIGEVAEEVAHAVADFIG